jgi:hypothetical protein
LSDKEAIEKGRERRQRLLSQARKTEKGQEREKAQDL